MSKLYATVTSDARKNPATCRGHKEISVHVRGWVHGIRVDVSLDEHGEPQFKVWRTGGSQSPSNRGEPLVNMTTSDWSNTNENPPTVS